MSITLCTCIAITATPVLDFTPLIAEELKFTEHQSMGDSTCTNVTIVQDIFVETMETFEVQLLPNHNDPLGAIIQQNKSKAIVIISDGEMDRGI